MAVFTFDLLDLFSMMAIPAILEKGLAVIVTGWMAIHTFHLFSKYMGLMGEFDVIERNGPPFDPNMAKGCTGHLGLEFLGFIIPIEGG
jgi:hypothetical protein